MPEVQNCQLSFPEKKCILSNPPSKKKFSYKVKCKPLLYFKSMEIADKPLSDGPLSQHYLVISHSLKSWKEWKEVAPSLPVSPCCLFMLLCYLPLTTGFWIGEGI